MNLFLTGAQAVAGALFGSADREQVAAESSLPPANSAHAEVQYPPGPKTSGYKALYEPIIEPTRKRERGAEEEGLEVQASKRRDSRKAEERRLTQTFEATPRDALPISSVPESYIREEATHVPDRKMVRGKVGGGPFRPQNNLNERPQYASKANRPAHAASIDRTVVGRLAPPTVDSMSARRESARFPGHGSVEEYFDRHDERENKRRKRGNHLAYPLPSHQDAIDLTDDDAAQDHSGEMPNRSTDGGRRHSNGLSQLVTKKTSSYIPSIATGATSMTALPTAKKRRKSKESAHSSQTSNRPSRVNSPIHLPPGHREGRSSPMVMVPQNEVPQMSQYSRLRMDATLPEIHRAGDVDTARGPNSRSRSIEDSNGAGHVMKAAKQSGDSGQRSTLNFRQGPHPSVTRRIAIDEPHADPDAPFALENQSLAQERRLSDTFKRDPGTGNSVDQHKIRAPQRMNATSGIPSKPLRRVSIGSDDEIAVAEPTIGSHASRNNSPQKDLGTMSAGGVPLRANVPTYKPLRGQLGRSTANDAVSHPAQKRARKSPTKPASKVDDEVRIPVTRILCRACCLEGDGIELVWDSSDSVFTVECEGQAQSLPHKAKLVNLSQNEVAMMEHAVGEGIHELFIKGSMTDVSCGKMLIGFATLHDLQEFHNHMFAASSDNLALKGVSKERMEGLSNLQSQVIKKDHESVKARKAILDHEQVALALMENKRRDRNLKQASDEEFIKYEIEDTGTRPSRRAQMRDGSLEQVHESPTMSKFFTDHGDGLRRSSRQSKPVRPKSPTPPPPKRWTFENKLEPWPHPLTYPPEGFARRVTIDFEDIGRLDEGEFLNDSIISFALRRIEENMDPEHKKKVYFFNSFFYEALTKNKGKKGFYYDAVKRWTKNTDLFNVPYLVVPINIDLHWFVVIICNLPNLPRKAAGFDLDADDSVELLDDIPPPTLERNREITLGTTDGDATIETKYAEASLEQLSLAENEKANVFDFDENTHPTVTSDISSYFENQLGTADSKKPKKKGPPPLRKYNPDDPTLITLDSFGSTRSVETRNLKNYLKSEAETKRGMDVNIKDLQGMTAKGIPEQTNFCDCGLYLVGYVEAFAKDPRKFVTKVLQRELDQQSDFAGFDPAAKRAEIRDQLLELAEQQDAQRKGKKSARKLARTNGPDAPAREEALSSTYATAPERAETESVAEARLATADAAQTSWVAESRSETEHTRFVAPLQHAESEELSQTVPRPLTQPNAKGPNEIVGRKRKANSDIDGTVVHETEKFVKPEWEALTTAPDKIETRGSFGQIFKPGTDDLQVQ